MDKKNATAGKAVAGSGLSTIGNGAQAHDTTLEPSKLDAIRQLADAAKVQPPGGQLWTVGDLLSHNFPEPVWAVPNLIPAGLSILAGRPKLGKSWLALQIAVATGSGGMVLGEQVKRRNVFYLALEDSERRLQDRLKQQGCPADAAIMLKTEWLPLIDGGLDHLQGMIEKHEIGLVIVDTLARWAGVRRADDESLVAQRLSDLQRYAVRQNVAVLLVDHHRKPGASSVTDVIDDVMGATAKTGTADAALGLYRQRGQQGAELKLTGRDCPDRELAVQFDHQVMSWQLLGDAAGVKANTLQAEILDTLKDSFGGECNATDLARFLGRDKSNVRKELVELAARGRLLKSDKQGREVRYCLPAEPAERVEREREEREN